MHRLIACAVVGITMLIIMTSVCQADGVDITGTLNAALPNTTPSMFYSLRNHEANFLTQYQLASKDTKIGTFELNAAYGESDTGLAVLAYKTDTLGKLGVNVAVLKDIFANAGYGIGYDHITKSDRQYDYGFMVGLGANIKFGPQK